MHVSSYSNLIRTKTNIHHHNLWLLNLLRQMISYKSVIRAILVNVLKCHILTSSAKIVKVNYEGSVVVTNIESHYMTFLFEQIPFFFYKFSFYSSIFVYIKWNQWKQIFLAPTGAQGVAMHCNVWCLCLSSVHYKVFILSCLKAVFKQSIESHTNRA